MQLLSPCRFSWNLAEANKPFADADLIKTCALDIVGKVLSDNEKMKKIVIELLKQVPLSGNRRGLSVFFQSTHQFEESRGHVTCHRLVL